MAVINLTSEEFADRIEEMLDLASKGDNVLIHHEGKRIGGLSRERKSITE